MVLQSTSGERKASASEGASFLQHLKRDRVPPTVEIPAGARLHVRLKERITEGNRAGDVFVGKLDRNVEQAGKLLAPQGSRVIGRITRLGEDTRRISSTKVSLVLEQMVVGEKVYPFESVPLTLSTPASAPSDTGDLSLQGQGFLSGQQESVEEPTGTDPYKTIYEPNTRLTFVLAGRVRLPIFVQED